MTDDTAPRDAPGAPGPRLSIVVPVGPGDDAWRGLIDALTGIGPGQAGIDSVVIPAPAGSHPAARAAETAIVRMAPGRRRDDGQTRDLPKPEILLVLSEGDPQRAALREGVRTLTAPLGRAHQLNAGIAAAHGEWLWLLHADSRLRADTLPALRRWLAEAPRALGWFRLAFDDDGPWQMPVNAFGVHLRARWLGLPFGDQGFLLHRDDARRLGPFDPALAHGEDHAWVWRARRLGLPLRPVGGTLVTSARRYAEHGWVRTTWRHLQLTWRQARQESRR